MNAASLNASVAMLLEWLLRSSVSAIVVAALVLSAQFLFARWLTPAWRYRLWGLVVLRLLLPALPPSVTSAWNVERCAPFVRAMTWMNAPTHRAHPTEPQGAPPPPAEHAEPRAWVPVVTYGAIPVPGRPELSTVRNIPAAAAKVVSPLASILVAVWLVIATGLVVRLLWTNRVLMRRLRDAVPITDEAVCALLARCCREARVSRPPGLLATDAVCVPAAVGTRRPRILMPPGLLERLSEDERRAVLLHELAHIRCRDIAINWLLAILQAVHWFNPLLWLAFNRLRADREVARDAMVLGFLGNEEPTIAAERYGRTLLKIAELLSSAARERAGIVAAVAGMAGRPAVLVPGLFGSRSDLQRRLQMITRYPDGARRRSWLGLTLAVLLAAAALTRAKDPPAPPAAATPRAAASTPATPPTTAPAPPEASVNDLVARAMELTRDAKFKEAIVVLDRILARDPRNSYALGLRPLLQDRVEIRRVRTKDERVAQQLDRQLPELTFDAVGFSDVIDFLRDVSGATIVVNWKALEAAGVEKGHPVTARLRNIKLSKALHTILDSVAGGQQKLGYWVADGAVMISTLDDKEAVEVRVYDIRDLLVVVTDFTPARMGEPESRPASGPATRPTDGAPSREELVKSIIRLIEETVAADTWKDHGGSPGELRELDGQLIVTQTRENQKQVAQLVQQLRDARGLQCEVNARFISCDEPVARGLLDKWRKAAVSATRPSVARTASDASNAEPVGLFLNEDQAREFFKAAQAAPGFSVIAAPRMTLFSGQRAYVRVSTLRKYLSSYTAVKAAGGEMRYEPGTSDAEYGLLMDVQATTSADRKSITLSLRPQVSALLGMKQVPWAGAPAGSHLMVESPQIRSSELQTTANVLDGQTLLLGGMEDPQVPEGAGAATRPDHPLRALFMLVTPRLIAPQPPGANPARP